MVLMRESFWRLFGDWMVLFALGEMVLSLTFGIMCYAGPKCYNFKLCCTFYFIKLPFIKVHYNEFL